MDEGLTVFLPESLQTTLSPDLNIAKYNTAAFSYYAGIEDEPAVITATHYLDAKIYFYLNYAKTEQALRMLEMQLGKELFHQCLLTFMERWKYKHPTPLDYFNTFNDVSKQDLTWYWQAWYYQSGGIPDLAITKVTNANNKFEVSIENKGDLPLPVVVTFYNNDKIVNTITVLADQWMNQDIIKVSYDAKETITKIILGSDIIPDANPKNNEYNL
jgi:hypothetical protein